MSTPGGVNDVMAKEPDKKPLMRSLGEFFGHIMRGVRTDPQRGKPHEVSRHVDEQRRGNTILRRTTIDEIEFRNDDGPPTAD